MYTLQEQFKSTTGDLLKGTQTQTETFAQVMPLELQIGGEMKVEIFGSISKNEPDVKDKLELISSIPGLGDIPLELFNMEFHTGTQFKIDVITSRTGENEIVNHVQGTFAKQGQDTKVEVVQQHGGGAIGTNWMSKIKFRHTKSQESSEIQILGMTMIFL